MGKIAFVFPGQGAQKVGMGKDAYDADPRAKQTFEAADAALGSALSRLCFEGPEEELQLTANTQPAILTASVALLRCLDEQPDAVAGHSLGEYTAHVAAGTFAFEAVVPLVRSRGEFMQAAVPVGTGAMAAVIGATREVVDAKCKEAGGVAEAVNFNSPGQIVIAGDAASVARAGELLGGAGAKVIPLKVSAPFHSSLMRPAEDRLIPELSRVEFRDSRVAVYANVDAAPITTAAAARDTLARQVSRPVRWEECVERMVADGVTMFVEIGPGKVLTGLIARIAKQTKRINVSAFGDIEAAKTAIAQERSAGPGA